MLCKIVKTYQWFSYTEAGCDRFLLNTGKILTVTVTPSSQSVNFPKVTGSSLQNRVS